MPNNEKTYRKIAVAVWFAAGLALLLLAPNTMLVLWMWVSILFTIFVLIIRAFIK